MANRALLIGLLVLLSRSSLWADGLELAPAWSDVYLNCFTGSASIVSFSAGSSTSASCDNAYFWGGDFGTDQAVGSAYTSFGTVPMADVSGAAWTDVISPGSAFYGAADVAYFVAIEQTATPPETVTEIPVTMTVRGETNVVGCCGYPDTYAYGTFNGGIYGPGVWDVHLAPDVIYFASVAAGCMAWISDAAGITYSECQAVADPFFQFNQTAFNAQMGLDTFPLSQYYGFAYSPNLTAIPEPSTFALTAIGFGTLGLTVWRRRK